MRRGALICGADFVGDMLVRISIRSLHGVLGLLGRTGMRSDTAGASDVREMGCCTSGVGEGLRKDCRRVEEALRLSLDATALRRPRTGRSLLPLEMMGSGIGEGDFARATEDLVGASKRARLAPGGAFSLLTRTRAALSLPTMGMRLCRLAFRSLRGAIS